jgi:hypothetical protein
VRLYPRVLVRTPTPGGGVSDSWDGLAFGIPAGCVRSYPFAGGLTHVPGGVDSNRASFYSYPRRVLGYTRLRAILRTNPRAAHKGAVLQAVRRQPRGSENLKKPETSSVSGMSENVNF